jgi:6-phosphogluconolactonase (cycloisomerase 2 family)
MKNILFVTIAVSVIGAAQTASLKYNGSYKEWNNGVTGLYLSQCIEFSPDGKNCYVGSYSGFTWYTVDSVTKKVTLSGNLEEGAVGGPAVLDGHGVVVSPDGKHVYTAVGYQRNSLCVYQRDQTTGQPAYLSRIKEGDNGITDMGYPYDVDISPDGKHLYVPCQASSSLLWFSRDAATGSITYKGKFVDGVNGADGLGTARNVDLSPDGKHLYLSASSDHSVSAYSRDAETGALTRVSLIKQGENGADCLENAFWVEVSPDGKFVYVSSQTIGGISWFSRDAESGKITYQGCVKGMSGCMGMAMHPSGKWIFASASGTHSITWLQRNSATGALTVSGTVTDGVGGVDGIGTTRYNAVSPKGNIFVATGYGDNGFAYFEWIDNTTGVRMEQSTEIPLQLSLSGNYPNPFNPTTTIRFSLDASGPVLLKIYDSVGREAATIVDEYLESGMNYERTFDASGYASGIYFARLTSGDRSRFIKMVLMK